MDEKNTAVLNRSEAASSGRNISRSEMIDKVYDWELAKAPIGQALILTTGMGLSNAISGAMAGMTKGNPLWIKLAIAAGLIWLKPAHRAIGPDSCKLLAVGIMAGAANDQFAITQKTEALFTKLFNRAKTTNYAASASAQAAAIAAAQTPTVVKQAEAVAADYYADGGKI